MCTIYSGRFCLDEILSIIDVPPATKRDVTSIVSRAMELPALNATLPASNNCNTLSEIELMFVPHQYEPKDLTAELNPANAPFKCSSQEEAKPVLL